MTLQDMIAADATQYIDVEAHGTTFHLGELSSGDMIDWFELQGEPAKAKYAGLYLLVMSLAGPDGERVTKEERDAVVDVFRKKQAAGNRALIKKARTLNRLDELGKTLETLKNVSGGASTGASPSDSPSKSNV